MERENAKLASKIYPGWTVRVYHDRTVPRYVLDKLRQENVQLIELLYSPLEPKTDWNVFVAFDPSVDRYIIRNIDSRLTWHERAAVDQWIESGKRFHIMRDHHFHSNNTVPNGLWSATHDAVPDIVTLIHTYTTNMAKYGTLQQFLNKEIWKRISYSTWFFFVWEISGECAFPNETQWMGVCREYIQGWKNTQKGFWNITDHNSGSQMYIDKEKRSVSR